MTVADLTPPADLSPFAVQSWANALEALEGQDGAAVREPLERYIRACDLVGRLREQWEADGRPMTTVGGSTGKIIVPHPLVKMIDDAEASAAKLWRELAPPAPRRGAGGRPRGSVSAPDRRSAAAGAPPTIRRTADGEPPRLRSVV